jgi:hypothetical protein
MFGKYAFSHLNKEWRQTFLASDPTATVIIDLASSLKKKKKK